MLMIVLIMEFNRDLTVFEEDKKNLISKNRKFFKTLFVNI